MKSWYKTHLGIESDHYEGCFEWYKKDGTVGHTSWSPFKENSEYFALSTKSFMINCRVENLEKLLEILKEEGIEQIGAISICIWKICMDFGSRWK